MKRTILLFNFILNITLYLHARICEKPNSLLPIVKLSLFLSSLQTETRNINVVNSLRLDADFKL